MPHMRIADHHECLYYEREDGVVVRVERCEECGEPMDGSIYKLSPMPASFLNPVVPGNTLGTLLTKRQEYRQAWEASEPGRISADVLRGVLEKQKSLKITSCIALALGSFSGSPNRFWGQMFDAPMSQLVAFESWVKILRTHFKSDIRVYIQEPEFNSLDREFLTHLGYGVIDSPASNDAITEESFLYAPQCFHNIFSGTLNVAFPALCLGVNVDEAFHRECPAVRKLYDDFLNQRARAYMALSLCHKPEEPTPPGYDAEPWAQNWQVLHPLYYRPDAIDVEAIKKRRVAPVNWSFFFRLQDGYSILKKAGRI